MSNTTVIIPPFPSQDLAKLVLGYLAEEQLMTAYDEFLQSSPYLDALRNEYDRIFMTSLKNILAEYRAVKIYVETCKPFILRRKLFQFTNLLEIVKYLINNVDINKLHLQEGSVDKIGCSRQSFSKSNSCDVCTSLKLQNCACKSSQSTSQIEATSLEGSVETTSLADLPGNISYKPKVTKETEPISNISQTITSSNQITDERSAKFSDNKSNATFTSDTTDNVISSVSEKTSPPNSNFLVNVQHPESSQNIEGLNDAPSLSNYKINDNVCQQKDSYGTETSSNALATDKVQNFAAGDTSGGNKVIVPDSSTSENTVLQTNTIEKDNVTNSTNVSKSVTRPPPLLIKIGNEHKHMNAQSTLHSLPRLPANEPARKTDENLSPKITILSDVKVDNDVKMPPILKGTASTLQMQTIYINGTPAYKNTQHADKTFTKDEIMAMPTIILVPATDTSKKVVSKVTQNNMMKTPSSSMSYSTGTTIEPLVIDLSSNDDSPIHINDPVISDNVKNADKQTNDMLLKTVDVSSVTHASLPKDNTLAGLKTSTPHVLPPTRKSSSTPRRTSHVRVLDFTTPRRILHETLNEHELNQCPSNEVALAQDSTLNSNKTEGTVNNRINNIANVDTGGGDNSIGATKENKTTIKLYNWDAELRALAYVGNGNVEKSEPARKSKLKKSKRKLSPTDKSTSNNHNKCEDTENKSNVKKKVTPKIKCTKHRKKSIEADNIVNKIPETTVPVVKPTINIISRKKWSEPKETEKALNKSTNVDRNIETEKVMNKSTNVYGNIETEKHMNKSINVDGNIETEKNVNKSTNVDGNTVTEKALNKSTDVDGNIETEKAFNKSTNVDVNTETPELEKMSLQNEIGAKLNISDFLETPYKQALYDIQMETPKFLGPGILDEPLSDIKIMNIPTPRFLNTPKIVQNTPSSYSSRPTDYSSGGSYYKPDDQDYILGNEIVEDDLSLPAESSKINKGSKTNEVKKLNNEKSCEGKSRPVRQCTKNVSYNLSASSSNRMRDLEDKTDKLSTCSESSVNKADKKNNKPKVSKSDKDNVVAKQREPRRKNKKYKSPTKKEAPKTFMKIKPRRTTPVKEVLGKGRKKASHVSQIVYIKSQPKMTIAGKERNVSFSPIEVASVPTKSRRKSSTPRKLHCSKRFNSESSGVNSPERKKHISQSSVVKNNTFCSQDSDSEQPLRWSDDGSHESKIKTIDESPHYANDSDDITRIKEYIKTTVPTEMAVSNEGEGTLQVDLIKRGFDVETARMIERDLLETPTRNSTGCKAPVHNILQTNSSSDELVCKISDKNTESDCSTSNNLQIVQGDDNDDFDLSVHECNEDTNNYFVYSYDEAKFVSSEQVKLKETFLMEICLDDVSIRLRAMPFKTAFEHECKQEDLDKRRIEKPASPRHEALYTPRKAQCYEIFDSTLTSLDTPLKATSPRVSEFESVTEIVLEVEKLETDTKSKPESKKRKRVQSGTSEESSSSGKKVKPDTSYLLNSAGIQNIDIESVLSKLHGP